MTTVFENSGSSAAPPATASAQKARTRLSRGRRNRIREARLPLESRRGREDRLVPAPVREDLEAERQSRRVRAGGHGDGRQPREGSGRGEDVRQVHRDRIVHFFAEPERGRGNRRRDDRVDEAESVAKVGAEQGAGALGPPVVLVGVAGRENEGPE